MYPAAAFHGRPRLFGALAEVFPVVFRPTDRPGESGSAPWIVFGSERPSEAAGRQLLLGDSSQTAVPGTVRFGHWEGLDARLRGRVLPDTTAGGGSVAAQPGDEILATVEERPVWLRRTVGGSVLDVVAAAPEELSSDEVLRDRLQPGRFLGLLPLVEFLREVCGPGAWQPPPTRACFVVDDPNLHWRSYGHLSYPKLVEHAREHGYHLAVAMVPFDGWYAHRRTVRLFRESTDVLSLCIHGNDHRLHELGRPTTEDEARRILAQAVRRTDSFERRTGLVVSRVLVPPFEACSAASMRTLLEVGFEAASTTRPAPWLPLGPPHSSYVTPDNSPTSGWPIAELTESGVPVLIRRQFDELEDVPLRAYLDQPVLLYGHVADLAGGLEPLAAAAAVVNSLPSVTWQPLGDIAAGNFERRRGGEMLELRPFARRLRVPVDPDVPAIQLQLPPREVGFVHGAHASPGRVDGDGVVTLPPDRKETVEVEISWTPERQVNPGDVPAPRLSPKAVSRRLLVEARDRLHPLLRRRG